ncbi:MAG: hypothetical protein HND55_01425 [Pseudomonadota bacterium]|nr:MAG: hypothetical protein HND55_01425 [Pseudomonadota bacterium]
MKPLALIGQIMTWAAIAALIGLLGQGLAYSPYDASQALIKFSLAHLSERLVPCRQLSEAERAELPPTRRVSEVCERGRAATVVELRLNDEIVLDRIIEPAGLSGDGRSYLFERFPVPAGRYLLELKLRDTPRESGFDLEHRVQLELNAGQAALIEVGDDGVSVDARSVSGESS